MLAEFLAIGPAQLALAALTLIAAGAIQGSTGFGFNMLAAPMLAVIDPAFVPAPMLLVSLMISISGAIREWNRVDFTGLGVALAGRTIASIAAVFCLGLLSAATFSKLFGVMVLAAVGISLLGLRLRPTPTTLFCAGSLSGFMGTLTSIGAPPMALVYQGSDAAVMRSTLNGFFVVGASISVALLWLSGHLDWGQLLVTLAMFPFAFAGFLFSHWGRRLIDGGLARPVILTMSAGSGIILILRTFF